MLFVGFTLEIREGTHPDPIRRYLQVQTFALRQLHSDIPAGIGHFEIFAQVPKAHVDIPAAGGSIQTAGKIRHPYIATRGPGL